MGPGRDDELKLDGLIPGPSDCHRSQLTRRLKATRLPSGLVAYINFRTAWPRITGCLFSPLALSNPNPHLSSRVLPSLLPWSTQGKASCMASKAPPFSLAARRKTSVWPVKRRGYEKKIEAIQRVVPL